MTIQAILPETASRIFSVLTLRSAGFGRGRRRQSWRRSIGRHQVSPVPAIPCAIAVLDHDRPVGELPFLWIDRILWISRSELRLYQHCAFGNIGLAIAREQPVPQRVRVVDLNIRMNPVRGADVRIMRPGLVAMIVQKCLQPCWKGRRRGRRERSTGRSGASAELEDERQQKRQEGDSRFAKHEEWWDLP